MIDSVLRARVIMAMPPPQIAHFEAAILNLTRNRDLAAVGHGLELLAVFP
jgi:hypothetical protein